MSTRPGLRPQLPADTTADAARKSGGTANPTVTQRLTAVVTIESIDRANAWITHETADNRRIVRAVQDPKLLDGHKAGDVIEVTMTRKRVIDLQRQ